MTSEVFVDVDWTHDLDVAKPAIVTGAGGFIGGHLVSRLRELGFERVRAVDRKPADEWYQRFSDVDSLVVDLSSMDGCRRAAEGAGYVFHLAADMGGMGFIENNKALCMLSVLSSTQMLVAARDVGAERYFYASSACVYAQEKQTTADVPALAEDDAYPATPEDGYGWEKLFSERMARHFFEDFGLDTRVARYHNVYGPMGTFAGGREKAPAAICRKVIEAKLSGVHEIEIWGDGEQTRSFTYIDDCVEGTLRLTASSSRDPLNVGSSEMVTINDMVSLCEQIGGVTLRRRYVLDAPLGVRGRNSDNSRIHAELNWEPSIRLAAGLERTYAWIHDQMTSTGESHPLALAATAR
ncbi:MAG: NAD-dependent epimerase/dehydratase family protein [Deltaproteobacteria bacterium]|nr:NAD-dependent epimerase/dehydratase family protein [Deltaproteobacteria bacterium]